MLIEKSNGNGNIFYPRTNLITSLIIIINKLKS